MFVDEAVLFAGAGGPSIINDKWIVQPVEEPFENMRDVVFDHGSHTNTTHASK